MTKLTTEQIEKLNNDCPYGQGIFLQPYGIPINEKRLVIYSSYTSGGYSGGSCWDDSEPRRYENEVPNDHMEALDKVLSVLCPNISYLNFKKIEKLMNHEFDTRTEYYGNSSDITVDYIVLDELYEKLEEIGM